MMNDASAPRAARLAPLLVAVAACVVYVNALANGFAYDDVSIIQQNARVHSLGNLRDIWLAPYWPFFGAELGIYRPFIIFLYAVQWAIGGGAAWLFHAVSIALHAGASVLVFALLDRLATRMAALVGALVFAVHPVHVEAVANIVGQAELVSASLLLAACLLHIGRPSPAVSWPRRLLLVGLFALGLLTKESAVVLPGLLVALDFATGRVAPARTAIAAYVRAMAMPILLLALTLAAYLILRFDVMSGAVLGVDAGPGMPYLREEYRILNAFRAFPEFMRLLFFPLELSADYSPGVILPVESLTWMSLLGALLLAGLICLALATPWWPAGGLPAAWFLIGFSTVSNLFFPIGVLVAERTLYLPSVALSLLLAYLWRAAAPAASPAMRRAAPVFAVVMLALLSVRTWVRNPDWKSTNAVWYALARDHPEAYRTHWVLGSFHQQAGRIPEAEFHFELAYRIHPRDSQFLVEYAAFLLSIGRHEQAVPLLEQSYALHSAVPRTVTMLAYAYLLAGRYEDALPHIAEAEQFGAARSTSMPARAHAYHGLGDHDRAVAAWRVALDYAPGDAWLLRAFLARSLAIAGRHDDALDAISAARSNPSDSAATDTLGRLDLAIRTGCYEPESATDHGRGPVHALRLPACDPLGDYFRRAGQTQIAVLLQNASGTGAAAAADSAVSRQ